MHLSCAWFADECEILSGCNEIICGFDECFSDRAIAMMMDVVTFFINFTCIMNCDVVTFL